MLAGDNSILQKATTAKENTERASIIEQARTDILAKIADKRGENLTEDEIEAILVRYGTLANNGESSILERILTSTKGNYEIAVSEIYNGILAPEVDTGYGLYDYETGGLKKSWSKLLKEGIVAVDTNGVLTTPHDEADVNNSNEALNGKLIISNDVRTLGANAFSYCENLQEIVLPNTITTIYHGAFNNCTQLKNVNLPTSLSGTIGMSTFSYTKLTSVYLPSGITLIADRAFEGCSELTEITIPESVTTIGQNAFYNCSKLTEITIPEGVTTIGQYAFFGCTSLTTATIKGNVTFKAREVFHFGSPNGPVLSNVTLGSDNQETGMKKVTVECLTGMPLTSITLKDSITSIDAGGMASLTISSITIPESITTIQAGAFYNWTSSQTINVSGYTSASQATGYANGWNGNATIKWRGQF